MQSFKASLIPAYGEPKTDQAPSNSAPITAAADIDVGVNDKLFIQNLGTSPLYVKRGTGATNASFNYVLPAGSANDDGKGGALWIDDFVGKISFAGASVRYNAWLR
jgi:hypothetical protein